MLLTCHCSKLAPNVRADKDQLSTASSTLGTAAVYSMTVVGEHAKTSAAGLRRRHGRFDTPHRLRQAQDARRFEQVLHFQHSSNFRLWVKAKFKLSHYK